MRSQVPRLSMATVSAAVPSRADATHRQPRSSYHFSAVPIEDLDEKSPRGDGKSPAQSTPSTPRYARSVPTSGPPTRTCSRSRSRPTTPITPCQQQHIYGYPAPSRTPLPAPCTLADAPIQSLGCRAWERFRPWIPIALWVATSLGFLLAIAFWRTEVFTGLDEFSHWLAAHGYSGYALLGFLIFVTTIPPLPLYSTFMTLSGYCFGALPGAVISYIASLSGAVAVFLLSRAYLKEHILSFFDRSPTFKRVVRAIERRPNVLFLVRLAPYPYNVMNVLLAASPTLTLRTYTICTALALFKVIIHTTIGASIHSFSHHGSSGAGSTNGTSPDDGSDAEEDESSVLSRVLQIGGIGLCVAVFLYISWVARRAVDNEADDDEARNSEERVAFLSTESRTESGEMTETTLGDRRTIARLSIADGEITTADIVSTPIASSRPRSAV